MKFYAVYDGGYEYIQHVLDEVEYEAEYGHLNVHYQPRVRAFDTRESAEDFERAQNRRAARYYGRG